MLTGSRDVDERRRALRVVSLLPSATEIVCALGAASNLVGISHECDFPEAIRDRPVLTRSRVATRGSSRSIDEAVRGVVRDALSVYAIDERLLAELRPDVVVTQDLCEVCAVSLDDVRSAVSRLARRDDVRIVSLRPTRLGDVFADVEQVAAPLLREKEGVAVRRTMQARIADVAARTPTGRMPRVASIEWIDPLMLGGTWMPELIELAGGFPVGVVPGGPAPTITPADLAALRPDVVVVKPCGFDLERALGERALLERNIVAAVGAHARVYVTDGNAFFNRPGPRVVESLEIMAACVHPEVFDDLATRHRAVIQRVG